jgi:hypothetical protein
MLSGHSSHTVERFVQCCSKQTADPHCNEQQVKHKPAASRAAGFQQQREQPDRPTVSFPQYRVLPCVNDGYDTAGELPLVTAGGLPLLTAQGLPLQILHRDCHYSYCTATATTVTAQGLPLVTAQGLSLQLLHRDCHYSYCTGTSTSLSSVQ